MKTHHRFGALVLAGLYFVACQGNVSEVVQSPIQGAPTPSHSLLTIPTREFSPLPTQITENPGMNIWVAPLVDKTENLQNLNQLDLHRVKSPMDNSLRLEYFDNQLDEDLISMGEVELVYAVGTRFDSLVDGISSNQLTRCWRGECSISGNATAVYIFGDPELFVNVFGKPSTLVKEISDIDMTILDVTRRLFDAIIILPFHNINPMLKILHIDGQSPVKKDFLVDLYPLKKKIVLRTSKYLYEKISPGDRSNLIEKILPLTNRMPQKLTVLTMTGVTAMVRATAWKMENIDIKYPGRDIRDWLRNADITHISNEVSFYEKCPFPDPNQVRLFFCSRPSYIELLADVGADIIELTGNHNNDTAQVYGVDPTSFTIDLYKQHGMQYYGGGKNIKEARRAVLIEHNGNKFAFIGCNPAGPDFAWATDEGPGAAPCGDYGWMVEEIRKLKNLGYIPVATFQYHENYSNRASETMRVDFRLMAEAGAIIVQGSQAHTPKEFEYYLGSFIHYGLGNLFFDQMHVSVNDKFIPGTRQEFIDRHVFYNGKHISTELLTAILEDYSKPRPMNNQERLDFLQEIFSVSKPWIKK